MPVNHGILREELIDQHGVTFNFKQKKNMKIKDKKVYCSSIYAIDYFYSRVPLSPEVDRSTTGWHSFKERQSLAADTERHFFESFRKQELNEFLSICGVPSYNGGHRPAVSNGVNQKKKHHRSKRRYGCNFADFVSKAS